MLPKDYYLKIEKLRLQLGQLGAKSPDRPKLVRQLLQGINEAISAGPVSQAERLNWTVQILIEQAKQLSPLVSNWAIRFSTNHRKLLVATKVSLDVLNKILPIMIV